MLSRSLATVFHWAHMPFSATGVLPAIVLLFFIKGLVQFGASTYQFVLTTRVTQRLRHRIVATLARADYRYVLGTNTGFLTNLVTAEVPRVTSAFLWLTRTFPPILTSVVFFGIVMTLDWQVTLVCIGVGALELVLLRLPNRLVARYSADMTRESSILTGLLIQTVQAFNYLRATARFAPLQRRSTNRPAAGRKRTTAPGSRWR